MHRATLQPFAPPLPFAPAFGFFSGGVRSRSAILGNQWQALLGRGSIVEWRFFLRKRTAAELVVLSAAGRVGS